MPKTIFNTLSNPKNIIMKKYYFLFLSIFFFSIACNQTPEAPNNDQPVDPTPTPEETLALQVNKMFAAKYVSASVYAGSTDYEFTDTDGKQIMIRLSNIDTLENTIMPDNMLEPTDGIEGPPGANPKMVGRNFTIEQNPEGKYTRVIYSRGGGRE